MSSVTRWLCVFVMFAFALVPRASNSVEAWDVLVEPGGTLDATNVQDALVELDTEKDRQIVFARDFADVLDPSGILGALAECGFLGLSGNCRILLPKGRVFVDDLAIGGLAGWATKGGLVIEGHGSGSSPLYCGTVLRYAGTGGVALRIEGVRNSVFRDFCIDATGAQTGLKLNAKNGTSALTMLNKFENIAIFNQLGAAIEIGDGSDAQIDKTTFENIDMNGGTHCVRINSGYAAQLQFVNVQCRNYANFGFDIVKGSATIANSTITTLDGLSSTAAVLIRNDADTVHVRESHFELASGDGIVTEGISRASVTQIVGNTFAMGIPGADGVSFRHGGSLVVTGNSFGSWSGNTGGVDFRVANATTRTLRALIQGNTFNLAPPAQLQIDPARLEQGGYGPLRVANGTTGSAACIATVGGRLFADVDCDDRLDPGEPPLDNRSGVSSYGPVQWAIAGTPGLAACSNAGLVCIDAHALMGGNSVGCGSTAGHRIVRCR